MSERPPLAVSLVKMAWCCLLASVLVAALLFPFAGGFGLASNQATDVVANGSAQLLEGDAPAVTTMYDAKGNPIAWLYSQRRFEVTSDQIADTMKRAIISIEDKRFGDHNGVDWKGTLTGLAGYASGDNDTRGGSTIEQQYVKNYNLLVNAQTDAERRAAVETTPARKLREIRMALALDKVLTKPEILTRYLNLESFGNARRFSRIARRVGRQKPVVAVKSGAVIAGWAEEPWLQGATADALLALNVATDFTSFRAALADFSVPSQNVVYADVDGHPDDRGLAFALEELKFFSRELRIVGVYPAHPFRATFSEKEE